MRMGNLLFGDSAFPPSPYPSGFDGWGFYIGGDTPHVWTNAEVNAIPTRFRLPIFTRSNPTQASPSTDASMAVSRLSEIGAPKGILVALDSETSVYPHYVSAFYFALRSAGYTLIDYGSQSFVFGNKNPDGYYWGADWTNIEHIASGDEMTQWRSLNAYDESTALPTLPFWDTRKVNPMSSMPGVWRRIISVEHQSTGNILVTGDAISPESQGKPGLFTTTFDAATKQWSEPVLFANYLSEG